jgi:hypothetical protein
MNLDPDNVQRSPEEIVRAQAIKDRSDYQAGADYAWWKELAQSEAFNACYLRRLKEKRMALEKSVAEGVPVELYLTKVALIAQIRELELMHIQERSACYKHLNPGKQEPVD